MHIKGKPGSASIVHKDPTISTASLQGASHGKELVINFINDLQDGIYAYDWDLERSTGKNEAMNVYVYGECGNLGFTCKTIYRYYDSSNTAPKFGRRSGIGYRFMRIDGAMSQTHGELILKGNSLFGHGRPYSINVDPSGTGSFREYISQSIKLNSGSTSKLVANQLNFKFGQDNGRTSELASNCEWKFFKVL